MRKINAYKVSVRKPEMLRPFGDLGIDGRIILKRTLMK